MMAHDRSLRPCRQAHGDRNPSADVIPMHGEGSKHGRRPSAYPACPPANALSFHPPSGASIPSRGTLTQFLAAIPGTCARASWRGVASPCPFGSFLYCFSVDRSPLLGSESSPPSGGVLHGRVAAAERSQQPRGCHTSRIAQRFAPRRICWGCPTVSLITADGLHVQQGAVTPRRIRSLLGLPDPRSTAGDRISKPQPKVQSGVDLRVRSCMAHLQAPHLPTVAESLGQINEGLLTFE